MAKRASKKVSKSKATKTKTWDSIPSYPALDAWVDLASNLDREQLVTLMGEKAADCILKGCCND